MPTIIRQATIEDKPRLFDFIQHSWKKRAAYQIPHRWQWLYISNPYRIDENLPIWIACDGERVVGHTAAMAIPLKIKDQMYIAGWSVNTLVLPEYRGKKLGYRLQKANQEAWPVFMSLSMTSTNRRIKMKLGGVNGPKVSNFSLRLRYSGEKLTLALEQRWENYLPGLGMNRRLAYFLGSSLERMLNAKLRIGRWLSRFTRKVMSVKQNILVQEIDRFDEALDVELEQFMKPYSVAVLRTSRYLNWKFVDQPHMKYKLFLARSDKQLLGYVILRSGEPPLENHYGVITEIMTNYEDLTTFKHLLSFSIKLFQRDKVEQIIISTTVPKWQELLLQFGFQKMGETIPVIHCSDKVLQKDVLKNGTSWLLSRGDHDWDQFPSRM